MCIPCIYVIPTSTFPGAVKRDVGISIPEHVKFLIRRIDRSALEKKRLFLDIATDGIEVAPSLSLLI